MRNTFSKSINCCDYYLANYSRLHLNIFTPATDRQPLLFLSELASTSSKLTQEQLADLLLLRFIPPSVLEASCGSSEPLDERQDPTASASQSARLHASRTSDRGTWCP